MSAGSLLSGAAGMKDSTSHRAWQTGDLQILEGVRGDGRYLSPVQNLFYCLAPVLTKRSVSRVRLDLMPEELTSDGVELRVQSRRTGTIRGAGRRLSLGALDEVAYSRQKCLEVA